MTSRIRFTLIDRHSELLDAWRAAFHKYLPSALSSEGGNFQLLQTDIRQAGTFDCVVSPANSYGIMDGGIDLYIALCISPSSPELLVRAVQQHLYRTSNGYLPAGQCTIAPVPLSLRGEENKLAAKYVAVLPTMRLPERVEWHKDIVYDCMWSLLVALDRHNKTAAASSSTPSAYAESSDPPAYSADPSTPPPPEKITSVVLSGLATGTGNISPQRCAEQMVLAVKHFWESEREPGTWGQMGWREVERVDDEVAPTRGL